MKISSSILLILWEKSANMPAWYKVDLKMNDRFYPHRYQLFFLYCFIYLKQGNE